MNLTPTKGRAIASRRKRLVFVKSAGNDLPPIDQPGRGCPNRRLFTSPRGGQIAMFGGCHERFAG